MAEHHAAPTRLSKLQPGAQVYLKLQNNRPFSVQNHHFSGAILYLCIFNRKFKEKSAFVLQFATSNTVRSLGPPPIGV